MKRWKLYFAYAHLPPHLQAVSKPFHDLADLVRNGGWGGAAIDKIKTMQETAVDKPEIMEAIEEVDAAFHDWRRGWDAQALRHLIRAKDCAVRAHIPDPPEPDAG